MTLMAKDMTTGSALLSYLMVNTLALKELLRVQFPGSKLTDDSDMERSS
jgi:hypothetical protein